MSQPQPQPQPRALEPAEMTRFGDLLDRTFPIPAGQHFFEDFPVWEFGPGVHRYGIFEGENLVASTGVRLCRLRVGDRTLACALVGAVATDPKVRGKGYASTLVEYASIQAKVLGARIALLWGSEHALYQRLGFELAGHQAFMPAADFAAQFSVSSQAPAPAPVPAPGRLFDGWDAEIFSIMKRRKTGLVLGPGDYPWIERHRHVAWLTWRENGVIQAFGAYGRGIDLPGILHDWGGKPSALSALAGALAARDPKALVLWGPFADEPSGGARPDLRGFTDAVALVKVLDPGATLLDLGLADDLVLHGQEPFYRLQLKAMPALEWQVSSREFSQLLFGPLPSQLEGLRPIGFPKPLWLWGLDAA